MKDEASASTEEATPQPAAAAAAAAAVAAAASLWRVVDPIFTWNFHMCRPLLDAGKL